MRENLYNTGKYNKYDVYDFLENADFRSYVIQSDRLASEDKDIFENWQYLDEVYADPSSPFQRARLILHSLNEYFHKEGLSSSEVEKRWDNSIQEYRKNIQGKRRSVKIYQWVWRSAAAVIAIIGIVFLLMWINRPEIIFHTDFGERNTIELPDGSSVHLNGNSSLVWDRHWKKNEIRRAELKGEGYFEVSKMASGIPFEVKAGGMTIEVLGTVFNVNSREEKTRVFLEEGKVNVKVGDRDKQTEMILEPGEKAIYELSSMSLRKIKENIMEEEIGWKEGLLVYREEQMSRVLEAVSDIYGKEFEVNDSAILDRKITTTIPLADWKMTSTAIQMAMRLTFSESKDTIMIKEKD